jgi:hypothetical protein
MQGRDSTYSSQDNFKLGNANANAVIMPITLAPSRDLALRRLLHHAAPPHPSTRPIHDSLVQSLSLHSVAQVRRAWLTANLVSKPCSTSWWYSTHTPTPSSTPTSKGLITTTNHSREPHQDRQVARVNSVQNWRLSSSLTSEGMGSHQVLLPHCRLRQPHE